MCQRLRLPNGLSGNGPRRPVLPEPPPPGSLPDGPPFVPFSPAPQDSESALFSGDTKALVAETKLISITYQLTGLFEPQFPYSYRGIRAATSWGCGMLVNSGQKEGPWTQPGSHLGSKGWPMLTWGERLVEGEGGD